MSGEISSEPSQTMHAKSSESLRYGRIALLYDRALILFGFRRGVSRFLARVSLDLPPAPRLLDAGCGSGIVSFALLRRFPGAHIIAFDLDERMLEVMWRRALRRRIPFDALDIAQGDLGLPETLRGFTSNRPLRLAPASFDAIVVSAALEHVALEQSLRSLHRLLKPGGVLLDIAVRRGATTRALAMLYDFEAYTIERLGAAFAAAGFSAPRIETLRPSEFPANLTRIALVSSKA